MATRSELARALDYIDAEIAKLQGVREALLATRAAVTKRPTPRIVTPKPEQAG
jgi:hypothetical protein